MTIELLGQLLDHGLQSADAVSDQPAFGRRPEILLQKLLADAIQAAPSAPDADVVRGTCINAFGLAPLALPAAPRSLARLSPLQITSGIDAAASRRHGAAFEGRHGVGPNSSEKGLGMKYSRRLTPDCCPCITKREPEHYFVLRPNGGGNMRAQKDCEPSMGDSADEREQRSALSEGTPAVIGPVAAVRLNGG